jgi:hypothetical protein
MANSVSTMEESDRMMHHKTQAAVVFENGYGWSVSG